MTLDQRSMAGNLKYGSSYLHFVWDSSISELACIFNKAKTPEEHIPWSVVTVGFWVYLEASGDIHFLGLFIPLFCNRCFETVPSKI